MSVEPVDAAAVKAFAIEMSRDPKEGLSARDRALMACIVIPAPVQKWMVEIGAVEPLLDSIEKTILAAERAAAKDDERLRAVNDKLQSMLLDAAGYAETYTGKVEWARNARAAVAAARSSCQQSVRREE
jgi:hypothetical protein